MSACNYIVVKRTKNGYEVCEKDFETETPLSKVYKFKQLKKAMQKAQALQEEDIIEYGIIYRDE